ncbi:PAAR domain-containing protein [Pseudomonas sp. PDM20]|uniref:PAAR domain-containing protein n=1 Tax=Pseudomonas sp. PDM20 TaxID=2769254 RepID=UPI00178388B3|nr:PAAR domain-containing protein [Pseudomonas sp. PDM20]MBD9686673.1 PAAR domain-containing protein [Pseudomonas sp. PDM20]
MRALACLGDLTTYGKIISATSTWLEGNKPIAQRGDLAWCSRCSNSFPINGTADDWFEEQPYVATGDRVLCRCPNHVVYGSATQFTTSAPSGLGQITPSVNSIATTHTNEGDIKESGLARLVPSTLSKTRNMSAYIENLRGKPFEKGLSIRIGSAEITDYWISASGRAYFIPPSELSMNGVEFAHIGSTRYELETAVKISCKIADITESLTTQQEVLRKAADEKFSSAEFGRYWRDQVYAEGYYQLEQIIREIESMSLDSKDSLTLSNWLSNI